MTLDEFLRLVVAVVDDSGIPYMLTGSIAVAYHAEPRATRDIDVVIAVSRDQIGTLVRRLDDEGFYVSQEAALDALDSQSQFNAIDPESGWKVDWIIRKDRPFSRREFERRQRVALMDLELPMVTAEDLIVAKLEWARIGASDRQLRDALAVLLQRGPDLDRAYVERWVGELGLDREWGVVLEEEMREEYEDEKDEPG